MHVYCLKNLRAEQQQTFKEKWLNRVHCAYKENRQVAESVQVEPHRPSIACCQATSLKTVGKFPERNQTPLHPSVAYPQKRFPTENG